jgi:SEC-C motif-containing protein
MKKIIDRCPCGLAEPYEHCCGVYIQGEANAPTPEALMRSRYTAYTQANMDYLRRTVRGKALTHFNPLHAEEWARKVQWRGLKVIHSEQNGSKGVVEFCAYFIESGVEQVLHELSQFNRDDGQWFYTDGSFVA